MFKKGFYAAVVAGLMIAGVAQAGGDSTGYVPPTSTMESTGVPTPPVCNTNTQKLHWNGSDWDCIGVGRASRADYATRAGKSDRTTGYAKGSIVVYSMNMSCPAGSTAHKNDESLYAKYACIKN